VTQLSSCEMSAGSGGIGERCVELRETGQIETGTEGLERGARGLQLPLSAAPFAMFEQGSGEQQARSGPFVWRVRVTVTAGQKSSRRPAGRP
jgi:hypothetical protein